MKKQTHISDLEDHLGYWIRYVSNQVSSSFKTSLEKQNMTLAEWVALRLLYDHHELSPASLADRMGVTRGAMTKIVDKLLKKELVSRCYSEEDRRFQIITLLDKGVAIVPLLAKIADDNEAYYFSSLTQEQIHGVTELLRNLVMQHKMIQKPLD